MVTRHTVCCAGVVCVTDFHSKGPACSDARPTHRRELGISDCRAPKKNTEKQHRAYPCMESVEYRICSFRTQAKTQISQFFFSASAFAFDACTTWDVSRWGLQTFTDSARGCSDRLSGPIASMGLVYLPIFTIKINQM